MGLERTELQNMPVLTTERLHLRSIQNGDLSYFLLLYRNDAVMQYFGESKPSKLSSIVAAVKRWTDRWRVSPFSWFCIFSRTTNDFIGACGLSPPNQNGECEIAYLLLNKYWGFGYATESVRELLRYAFEDTTHADGKPSCHKIFATVRLENKSSQKVLQKALMTPLDESSLKWGNERYRYEITREDYLKNRNQILQTT